MKGYFTNLRTRLYFIAGIILLVGLGSSLLIYLTSENNVEGVPGYEAAGGDVYPIAPEDSKRYMHDLELYGGKANVLANEFMNWFAGLWHGRSLAFTAAFITLLVSLGFFLAANRLTSGPKEGVHSKGNRHESS